MSSFEGSYLGASDKIGPRAIMECKICWTPYDPAEGDDTRQVSSGTSFHDLPEDWTCPGCSAPKEQFLVREDPDLAHIAARSKKLSALAADFRDIYHSKMRDLPMVNQAIHIETVGFIDYEGGLLGVLVAPWFMNLIFLPPEDRKTAHAGAKEIISFPSGDYEFIHNSRDMTGPYLACSLFSPMGDFSSQLQAVDVARNVMIELFKSENRAETDRSDEIRAIREAELAPPPEPEAEAEAEPSRRKLITGGLDG